MKYTKRIFDIFFAFVGLFLTWWLIALAWLIACLETHSNGFFIQDRAKPAPHSNAASIGHPLPRYSGFSPESLANSSVVT